MNWSIYSTPVFFYVLDVADWVTFYFLSYLIVRPQAFQNVEAAFSSEALVHIYQTDILIL
jgi:hypothetical protein